MRGTVLLGIRSPGDVGDLFFYQGAEIHAFVELICFGTGVGYEAFCVESFGDLG